MKFTIEEFAKALDEAVEERGEDFIYPQEGDWVSKDGECMYSLPDGSPACLIGVALHKLDPSLVPAHGAVFAASLLIEPSWVDAPPIDYARLVYAADAAQIDQDRGRKWGTARETFHAKLGL